MSKIFFAIITIIIKEIMCNTLEEKFINMLPKQDKDKVLYKIALRIGEEITSTAKPLKEEIELSEKDMDKHNDYVVKVLRQAAETYMDSEEGQKHKDEVDSGNGTERVATPNPTQSIETLKPTENVSTSNPTGKVSTLKPIEDVSTPKPLEKVSTPKPLEKVSTPKLGESVYVPTIKVLEKGTIVEPKEPIVLLNIKTLKNETVQKGLQPNKGLKVREVLESGNKNDSLRIESEEEKSVENEMKIVQEALQNKDDFEVKEIDPSNTNLYLPENIYENNSDKKKSEPERPIPVYNYGIENAYFNPKTRYVQKKQNVPNKFFDYDISLYEPKLPPPPYVPISPLQKSPLNDVSSRTVDLMTPKVDSIALDYYNGRQQSEEVTERVELKQKSRMNVEQNLEVLKDMFERDNEYLTKYDWLGSTVDFLAAVDKIITSADTLKKGNTISSIDMKLLNYFKTLYNDAKPKFKTETYVPESPMWQEPVPIFLKDVGKAYNHYFGTDSSWEKLTIDSKVRDDDFVRFLIDLEAKLSPLHMHINKTNLTYRNQIWFTVLKNRVAEEFNKEELLRILLHIYTTNLLDRVEKNFRSNKELKPDTEVMKHVLLLVKEF